MIEQSLQNRLRKEGIDRPVITIITQIIVDKDDPQIADPSKFIGQFYTPEEAKRFKSERNWAMKKDANRGWRRVVPSPQPLSVIEADTIKSLVDNGTIVIAAGGGGIPVYIDEKGNYEGLDAVIDKDLASAVLGKEIGSEILIILTSINKVAINFGRLDEKLLDTMTISEAQKYYDEGQFPPGSMGPKIRAAIQFIKGGGKEVIITSLDNAGKAVEGTAGTRILPD
jgi:carbamate kinase